MGFSSSIQFREPLQIVEAFKNRGVDAWSITCGKQFMFKGIGEEDFSQIINTLAESDSSATYTVQVYEDIDDVKKIKNNTPNDGSFNFKLNEDLRQRIGLVKGYREGEERSPNNIFVKLESIEKQLAELQAQDEEDSEQNNSLGMIGELLAHPVVSQVIGKLITGAGAVGVVPQSESAMLYKNNESNAYEALKEHDPKLNQHLEKLLLVAKSDPQTFQAIIKNFD
jgi:hypothetical protein